ncbi:MAG: CDP-diacylglycerol--glycerol-3-phosphate 3-phosphatidyltransferase [Firmicutes bacterium]|nr:CDP-diacylglycerol--glycerol-3-phosphate 3-phosphatidyltransferase [Bacillota bacterium]
MNIPNFISLLRILLIPVMVVFFYINIDAKYLITAAIFAVCAFTDFIDGYLARKLDKVTNMGKFLDPIADKVLIAAALFLLVEVQAIPSPYLVIGAALIIARELIIGGFRQIAAANNIVIAADRSGKIKTFVQDISIIVLFFLLHFSDVEALKYVAYFVFILKCFSVFTFQLFFY